MAMGQQAMLPDSKSMPLMGALSFSHSHTRPLSFPLSLSNGLSLSLSHTHALILTLEEHIKCSKRADAVKVRVCVGESERVRE